MAESFYNAIKAENALGRIVVIPDIKRVSPKYGDLTRSRDPVETAERLVGIGAPVLSVVTERERFGGSTELLREIVRSAGAPVLRKDFIINEDMLKETAEFGAAAVLLICAITDEKNLESLYEKALELNIEPFVEAHTEREINLAAKLRSKLIGINNKDITNFELDGGGVSRTAELAGAALPAKKNGSLLISESGILTPDDARRAADSGADAVLVGTALWDAADMGEMYKSLRVGRNRAGGN